MGAATFTRRQLEIELIVALVAASLLLAAILVVLPVDQFLAADVRALTNPALDTFLTDISVFGDVGVSLLLLGLAVTILAWRRRWLEAWFLLASTAGADALGIAIKILVGRPRPILMPEIGLLWQRFDRYSFPSGHAVFYTAFFGAVAFLLWRRFTGRARWAGIALCLALIVLVGPSRVFLGAHWPSDILAGYLVGGSSLFGMVLLYQWKYGW